MGVNDKNILMPEKVHPSIIKVIHTAPGIIKGPLRQSDAFL